MTVNEARFVLENRELYSPAWVLYAVDVLEAAGEWPFDGRTR